MMRSADVLEILERFGADGVTVWLDGGWGVDALMGEQTRPHDDLDVVLALAQTDRAVNCLGGIGFAVDLDDRPTRLVLRDGAGRQVDVHPVTFDADGTGWQRGGAPGGADCLYPANGFTSGAVAGQPVPCLVASVQMAHHLGYPPDEKDWHDVRLLHEHHGVDLPEPYGPPTATRL